MILFINSCVRADSRTKRLADRLLNKLGKEQGQDITELRLSGISFPAVDEAYLRDRDRLSSEGLFDDAMFGLARQFAAADEIVIAAPYWDLSFPAALKQYLEIVNVVGITFKYSPEGIPQGLCRAGRLWYVSTAGGHYVPEEFGYGYVKALAQGYYGIPETRLISACGLDIAGADPEAILREAISGLSI